jgi:very-short-patch-repair endonuclease
MDLALLRTIADEHHGVLPLDRLLRTKALSRAAWYRALDAGVLVQVHPGIAHLVGTATTREHAIAAAVLAAGKGAMASHRSAAHLWGVPRPLDDPIDVILSTRAREATLHGVVVHRPRDRKDLSPVQRSGIKTSNVLRMLCDLGAVDPGSVPSAVEHVVTSGLASPAALRTAVDVHSRRGRHGVPAFRAALDDWVLDSKPVDSVLEPTMRRLVTDHGLPPVEFHPVLCGYEVDFLVIDSPVVLECDGWDSHGRQRDQFEGDRVRDATLAAAGYVTIRFTYRQVTRRAGQVAERIRAVLRRWAPDLLTPATGP